MEFRILGPLEVIDNGTGLPLGGPQQRLVLAYLILDANRVVPTDRLIDRVWGGEPTDGARSALFAYISRLKKLLGSGRIQARPPGYVLTASQDEVDSLRFAVSVAEAKARTDPVEVASGLADALALWRGDALADLADHEGLQASLARLDEQRLAAEEDRADALLAAGRHREALGQLEALVGDHPLRERPWMVLMLALYRSGRQGDALAAFHRVRKLLADELGIDPSPELRELHDRMLQQDSALDSPGSVRPSSEPAAMLPPQEAVPVASARSRRPVIAAGLIAIAIIAIAALGASVFSRSEPMIRAGTVLQIDRSSGAVTRVIAVGRRPAALAFDGTRVWVANFDDRTIQAIDPRTGEAAAALGGFPGNPVSVTGHDATVWVALAFPTGSVTRVDLRNNNAIAPIGALGNGVEQIVYRDGVIWATNSERDELVRIDVASGRQQTVQLVGGPTNICLSPGAVWVSEPIRHAVVEIDPEALAIERIVEVVSGAPDDLACGDDVVWATNPTEHALLRIDPAANGLATTIRGVGSWPTGVAADQDRVWVVNERSRTVTWLDPRSGIAGGSLGLPVGTRPMDVLVAADDVWVAVQAD